MKRAIGRLLTAALLAAGLLPMGAAGAASADGAGNSAPAVYPALREWQGGQGRFSLTPASRIVLDPAERVPLGDTARTFATDLAALTGRTLPVVTGGTARAGDITLSAGSTDPRLGPQGYALGVGDALTVEAASDTGVFYATQTIEQAFKLDEYRTSIPRGTARDWPDVEQRAEMLDVGRRFFPVNELKAQIREMAWQKLTTFHLHLTDWSGFRIRLDEFPGLASADAYTPAQIRELQNYAREYHVEIVPEVDLPGHANAITSYDPSLRFACPSMDYGAWPGGERGGWTLDITKEHTRDFVHDLLEAVIPLFDSRYFHVGGDEIGLDDRKNACPELVAHQKARGFAYAGDVFVDFLNTLNDQVRSHGRTTQAWEWWDQYGQQSSIEPDRTIALDDYIDRDPTPLVAKGYTVVAAPEALLYVSAGMGQKLGQYGYVDVQEVYEKYGFPAPERSGGRVLGYKVARWGDGAESRSTAFLDHFARRPLQVMAERTWGSPRSASVWAYLARVDAVGGPPGSPAGHLTAVPTAGMTATADSEETTGEEGRASQVLDSNPYTAWHTAYTPTATPMPHHVTVDMGARRQLAGFRYLPRQDAAANGRIGDWAFAVSDDGTAWRTVARGTFANDQLEKEVVFAQTPARYVRLTATSAANGLSHAGAAELTLLRPASALPGTSFRMLNAGSGKAVDVPASASAPGTRLVTWTAHGGDNQSFSLHRRREPALARHRGGGRRLHRDVEEERSGADGGRCGRRHTAHAAAGHVGGRPAPVLRLTPRGARGTAAALPRGKGRRGTGGLCGGAGGGGVRGAGGRECGGRGEGQQDGSDSALHGRPFLESGVRQTCRIGHRLLARHPRPDTADV